MTHIPAMIFLFAFSLPDSLENELLSLYPQAFREDATTLSIATANGDTVAFRNRYDSPDGLRSTIYRLVNYLPEENLWTVKTLGYEWIGWQVVDGVTGSTTATIGPPVPSPDGTRLLCMNEDIHAGYTPNGIQVWRVEPGRSLVLEFEDTSVPWGPRNGQWLNDTTIGFIKLAYDYDTYDYTSEKGKLKLIDGLWTPPDPEDWDW